MTDLIPAPITDLVPDGWWEAQVVPWADQQVEETEIERAAAHIAGMIAHYRTLDSDTLELTKARRYLEIRWGELLGEGASSQGHRSDISREGEKSPLSKDDRYRFRQLAEHKDEAVETLRHADDADQITRAALLKATKPKPEPTSDFLARLHKDGQANPAVTEPNAQQATVIALSDHQGRLWRKCEDFLGDATRLLDRAGEHGIAPHAAAELIRRAALHARDAQTNLNTLAFTLE